MCDTILFLTVAPISNVHPFVVACVAGYILTVLRLASYILSFVLLFGFRYYKHNEFELKGVASLLLDFIGLFLVLFSVSSSLATLINLGIPETKSIRVTYAIATFVIVIITYVKYYTVIDAMRVETANKKTEHREICYEVINHITFWIKPLFGDTVLIILNGLNTMKMILDMLGYLLYLLWPVHCLGVQSTLQFLHFVMFHYASELVARRGPHL